MGYNLQMPWDLSESNREGFPVVGSSSFGAHKTAKDCFVDLKLGRLGDPGEGLADKFEVPQASPMDPRSSRKTRVRAQVASCLVDGCRSDLSTCRDYHRRHKVCEVHSKTAVVTIGGHERRFCQQCSRFHSLAEFDEGKRSCRKRLDGHNRRRRKPQPQPRTLNPGKYLSNHQGARYFPFTNPQACATRSPLSSVWAGLVKTENDPTIPYNNSHSHSPMSLADRKNPFAGALSQGGCEGGKQISFLQGTTSSLPGDYSLGEAFPDPHCTGDQKMFIDGLNRVMASDCALSLLSSPPSKTQEFGFNSHPLMSSSGYNNLRAQVESAAGDVMDSGGGAGGNLHSPVMFRSGIDGSSAGMSHPTLFFSWE